MFSYVGVHRLSSPCCCQNLPVTLHACRLFVGRPAAAATTSTFCHFVAAFLATPTQRIATYETAAALYQGECTYVHAPSRLSYARNLDPLTGKDKQQQRHRGNNSNGQRRAHGRHARQARERARSAQAGPRRGLFVVSCDWYVSSSSFFFSRSLLLMYLSFSFCFLLVFFFRISDACSFSRVSPSFQLIRRS